MDRTDWINRPQNNDGWQHDCLHVLAAREKETSPYQIISYCLSESPSQWKIQDNHIDPKFTFDQLHQQNVTSELLYLWSAPIDMIERYQFYLNQLSATNQSDWMGSQWFHNCTSPRFGPSCQYSLETNEAQHSSLNKAVYEFYSRKYRSTALTCYEHLECERGSKSMCLDWTEICDGIVHCRNGVDEEHCWQLQDDICEENAYRCGTGQCIARIFVRDDSDSFECLNRLDESRQDLNLFVRPALNLYDEPTFKTEDVVCPYRYDSYSGKITSSCQPDRDGILKKLLLFDQPNSVTDDCWLTLQCALGLIPSVGANYSEICLNGKHRRSINETCLDDILTIPGGVVAFGHVFFIYWRELMNNFHPWIPPPHYICYDDQLCDGLPLNKSLLSFNNATCRRPQDFPVTFNSFPITRGNWYNMYVVPLYNQLLQCNKLIRSHQTSHSCNNVTMYQCLNSSKCIAKDRLCDQRIDCGHRDDEQCTPINGSCALYGLDDLFLCTTTNICIAPSLVEDNKCHCRSIEYEFCDDEASDLHFIRKHISFTTMCDGFTELIPLATDGQNETDETQCEYWPCNNTYTRCDGFWNCFDGADEVDCDPSPALQCPSAHHICVSPLTNQFMCLSLDKADDGIVDCLGGTDEPRLCRSKSHKLTDANFYCYTYTNESCTVAKNLCYNNKCQDGSDMQFCDTSSNDSASIGICWEGSESIRSDIDNLFCTRRLDTDKSKIVPFAVGQHINSMVHSVKHRRDIIIIPSPITEPPIIEGPCHRGLPLQVWLENDGTSSTLTCLCPPSFYGDRCQYQNQRVSLTLKFQASSHSRRTLFAVLATLIDSSDQRIIHSYQQITYLYTKHCPVKYNIYLLYSHRPKLPNRNYSIHIDIYDKDSLVYRGSLLIALKFPFLPVHRIAVHLNMPNSSERAESCSDKRCQHGRCHTYLNDPNGNSFCRCDPGWSGRYCDIPYDCTCSSDLSCAGVSADNRSICVFPRNKWGSRCLLQSTFCQYGPNAPCFNDGESISIDEHVASEKHFVCICRRGFSGERCELVDKKIIVSFQEDITLPQSILIHFFRLNGNQPPEVGSTYRTVPTNHRSVTILWSRPFHIAAVEILNDSYYLVSIEETYYRSSILSKIIQPSDRCAHFHELFNQTIINFYLLRRIKYYHLPCQNRSSPLSCFFDDTHFCLCNEYDQQRVANCFEFNASMKHDCFGQSNCENGAQCLQDRPNCPEKSVCVCPQCFYGVKCQFSTSLFGLSLDGILGYHIQPYTPIKDQPRIVKVSVMLMVILFVIGLINGILSLMTFIDKEPRQNACGTYLLASSAICLFVPMILAVKFSILMVAQITYMTNQSFLYFQCMSLDFLLDIGLNMDQWLNACIALERAKTVIQGVRYNQTKSRQWAKYLIIILVCVTVGTAVHDPIHRHLLVEDDNDLEENRIWCIVRYSAAVLSYNSFISMFYFLGGFIVNIISAIIIIVMTARQRASFQTHQTYRKILVEQIHHHMDLLISSVILVIIALPRLIISFVGGCMKSTADSWLFLFGYFISFVPSAVTFMVFVVPSRSYRLVFQTIYKQHRRRIQSAFNRWLGRH